MNAYANVSLIENKLDELLSENHLVHTFRTSSYPVVLTISQDASPEAQVTLFESTDGSVSSRDAKLRLIFELDGLKIQTSSRLVLTDALMNKIKGLAKKLNSAYKEAFSPTGSALSRMSTRPENLRMMGTMRTPLPASSTASLTERAVSRPMNRRSNGHMGGWAFRPPGSEAI